MTISDSIINWLNGFTSEYWSIDKIETDIQSDSSLTYALTKEPITNVKRYVSGREEHTEYYQFSARLDSQTNTDRKDNGGWLEALEKWIFSKNKAEEFPTLESGTVSHIGVSSTFYLGKTNENTSVYSLTIEISYTIL